MRTVATAIAPFDAFERSRSLRAGLRLERDRVNAERGVISARQTTFRSFANRFWLPRADRRRVSASPGSAVTRAPAVLAPRAVVPSRPEMDVVALPLEGLKLIRPKV